MNHRICDHPLGRELTGRGLRPMRGAGRTPGAGREPQGRAVDGRATPVSTPEELGGAQVLAGISSCNDNIVRDKTGDPTARTPP